MNPEAERHGWLYWQVSDALVLTERALRHIPRNPELLVFSTIQPVMFVVLFRYVLGGAIKLPPGVALRQLPDGGRVRQHRRVRLVLDRRSASPRTSRTGSSTASARCRCRAPRC